MSSPAATPSTASSKVFGASPASFVEPSPASTFGDSTASDAGGGPKTPGHENDGTYLEMPPLIPAFHTVVLLLLSLNTFIALSIHLHHCFHTHPLLFTSTW
jgi:hypothetical protein